MGVAASGADVRTGVAGAVVMGKCNLCNAVPVLLAAKVAAAAPRETTALLLAVPVRTLQSSQKCASLGLQLCLEYS